VKPKFTIKHKPESGNIHKIEVFITKENNVIIHRHIFSDIQWPGELQRIFFDHYLVKQEIMFGKDELPLIVDTINNLK